MAALALLLAVALQGAAALDVAAPDRVAVVLRVEGVIGPATAAYVSHGIRTAAEQHAALIVLRIDTPGGLDVSMRDIVRDILGSGVPVISYVSPSGARAASAGTYILYASHFAAMAPGTNLGAATPVRIGASPDQSPDKQPKDQQPNPAGAPSAPSAHAPDNTLEAKAVNDAVAYIRALAELRDRNADWAEKAVREAASLSAQQALAKNVVNIIAPSLEDLIAQVDGRVTVIGSTKVTLDTKNLSVKELAPSWRTRFLAAITNPNVALILMMIGIYGLIIEFWSPGVVYPGTIGAICLLLGLYALAELPVNYAGLIFLVFGLALMVAEVFAPSFGSLGLGGLVAFVIGASMLVDTENPDFQVSRSVIAGVSVAGLGLVVLVARSAMISRRRQVITGSRGMTGSFGEVEDWTDHSGHVLVHGERWNAVSEAALVSTQRVRVLKLDGLTLTVEPG
jgi:membrane-bound serine protease (ClpP class)